MIDSQLHVYQNHPEKYAEIWNKVNIAHRHGSKPCIGDGCDLDAPCKRHDRTLEVVERYYRLRNG